MHFIFLLRTPSKLLFSIVLSKIILEIYFVCLYNIDDSLNMNLAALTRTSEYINCFCKQFNYQLQINFLLLASPKMYIVNDLYLKKIIVIYVIIFNLHNLWLYDIKRKITNHLMV